MFHTDAELRMQFVQNSERFAHVTMDMQLIKLIYWMRCKEKMEKQ